MPNIGQRPTIPTGKEVIEQQQQEQYPGMNWGLKNPAATTPPLWPNGAPPAAPMAYNMAARPDMQQLFQAQMGAPTGQQGYQNYMDQFYRMLYGPKGGV